MPEKKSYTKEEFEKVKQEARDLKLRFHPAISYAKLKDKVNKEADAAFDREEADAAYALTVKKALEKLNYQGAAATKVAASPKIKAQRLAMSSANRLVRCRVTCMDPSKKDMPGAIIGSRNALIPMVKKFIHYDGRETHLPQILIDVLKEKEHQLFRLVNNPDGTKVRKSFIEASFNIQIIEHLTTAERAKLADAQVKAGSLEA